MSILDVTGTSEEQICKITYGVTNLTFALLCMVAFVLLIDKMHFNHRIDHNLF